MIRVILFDYINKAYGLAVTDWENLDSESGFYNSLLEEDLLERVSQGDKIIYFNDSDTAEEWCSNHGYSYEEIIPEDDDN